MKMCTGIPTGTSHLELYSLWWNIYIFDPVHRFSRFPWKVLESSASLSRHGFPSCGKGSCPRMYIFISWGRRSYRGWSWWSSHAASLAAHSVVKVFHSSGFAKFARCLFLEWCWCVNVKLSWGEILIRLASHWTFLYEPGLSLRESTESSRNVDSLSMLEQTDVQPAPGVNVLSPGGTLLNP